MTSTFRYAVSVGLAGCYMHDSVSGPLIGTTRRELADAIRYELEFHGFPASLFREVRIKQLWRFIKRRGSSVAQFSLVHKGYEITFHGLTEAECDQMEAECDQMEAERDR